MSSNVLDEATACLTILSRIRRLQILQEDWCGLPIYTGVNGSPTQNFAIFSKLSEP